MTMLPTTSNLLFPNPVVGDGLGVEDPEDYLIPAVDQEPGS
jgi:hypothetical protein